MSDAGDFAANETVRQRVMRWLTKSEHSFEDLRLGLEISARELEEELRHVQKSARREGMGPAVVPPRCRDCGFGFPGRLKKHLHPLSCCPKCKSHRIEPPRFRVAARRS
ncbi:MAG: transcriptional regulator [Gemmatimonadota bacterium]